METQLLQQIFSVNNIIIYLVAINIITFLLMWYDKHEARIQQWRVSEKALFLFVLFGGSIGGIAGMYVFHHKTKKGYFKFGFPAILICQIIVAIYFMVNTH